MHFTATSSFLPRHFFVFTEDAPKQPISDLKSFAHYDRSGALYSSIIPTGIGSLMTAISIALLMNEKSFGGKAIGIALLTAGAVLIIGGVISLAIDIQHHRSVRFFVRERRYAATSQDESLALLLRTLIMTEFRVEGLPSFATALEYSHHFESVHLILVEYFWGTKEIDEAMRTAPSELRRDELSNELHKKATAVIELVGRTVNTEMMRLQESPTT